MSAHAMIPAVTIEIQEALGPQPGTGYVDCTGMDSGRYRCGICDRPVILAFHVKRPDGVRPVILDAKQHPGAPWRAFTRKGEPGKVLAEFYGHASPHAGHVNHRLICCDAYLAGA